MTRIYLDHNATTPIHPEVAEAVQRALVELPGNPSSVHQEGARAREAVERARGEVAALVGASAPEIVFTSGASESNRMALRGLLAGAGLRRLATSPVEHPSLAEPAAAVAEEGAQRVTLAVDGDGRVAPEGLAEALAAGPALVSLVWGHHETGVLQPVSELARVVSQHGSLLHVDATQCPGRLDVDVERAGVDALSASAHKLGGPKGVGFLYLRQGTPFRPTACGGPQERGRRAGTENVPGIVGLGVACRLARHRGAGPADLMARLRDRLWQGIREKVPDVRCVGAGAPRLPNTLLVAFRGAEAEALVQALDLEGVAVSAGAACASGSVEPSPALRALGLPEAEARACVRFSLGVGTREAEVERVLALLPDLVRRVRGPG